MALFAAVLGVRIFYYHITRDTNAMFTVQFTISSYAHSGYPEYYVKLCMIRADRCEERLYEDDKNVRAHP